MYICIRISYTDICMYIHTYVRMYVCTFIFTQLVILNNYYNYCMCLLICLCICGGYSSLN